MKALSVAAGAALFVATTCQAMAQSPLDEITTLAAASKCAAINWKNRGKAPKAYVRGMALVFARSVCETDRADVKVVQAKRGTPDTPADHTDGLTWYDDEFVGMSMPNDRDGIDTLRHAYVLMIGLGMRESSGKHCTGRDRSADFTKASSAEAGLFQTSWGVNKAHPTLRGLFDAYSASQSRCLLDVFKQGVSCPARDAETFGNASDPKDKDGMAWQKLTKSCPAFATEYAAVVLRASGGEKGEYGPIRKKAAELQKDCDAMLSQVQALAQSKPAICQALK